MIDVPLKNLMEDWIDHDPFFERPETFLLKYHKSGKYVYEFVVNTEDSNYVQASNDNNICLNDKEGNNFIWELSEEEGNTSGEVGRTKIWKDAR